MASSALVSGCGDLRKTLEITRKERGEEKEANSAAAR